MSQTDENNSSPLGNTNSHRTTTADGQAGSCAKGFSRSVIVTQRKKRRCSWSMLLQQWKLKKRKKKNWILWIYFVKEVWRILLTGNEPNMTLCAYQRLQWGFISKSQNLHFISFTKSNWYANCPNIMNSPGSAAEHIVRTKTSGCTSWSGYSIWHGGRRLSGTPACWLRNCET